MLRLYLGVFIVALGVLALAGCRDGGGELENPEIVEKVATNQGADLKLTWKSVENAEEYRVYCDGNKIWSGKDTTYTIEGSRNVCKTVIVAAAKGEHEHKTSLDLTPKSGTISDLVSHDSPTGNSWVKIDFTTGDISSTRQANVDKNAPNTAWFVFYNNSGTPQFRDASATSIGQAKMEIAFTDSGSGSLAPGTGNYRTDRNVASGGYYFFWADNTSTGYGNIDANDYFGVVKVTSLSGSGPYTANLEIHYQKTVPGLRWVPVHVH